MNGLDVLINAIKGVEWAAEKIPFPFFSKKLFDLATNFARDNLLNITNNNISLEEKLAVANSFFRNPEFPYISTGSKQAITRVLLNFASLTPKRRDAFSERNGFPPPTHLVISPTERCNYKCIGCYAAGYEKHSELSKEEVQEVIDQGKEMGMFFFVISGGEPFLYKGLMDIFKRNSDTYFLVYTNGSKLADNLDLCKELAKLGNVAPGVSIEGTEKQTDRRREKGAYDTVIKAWKNLTDAGVFHGFSVTSTSQNADYVTSGDFAEEMIKHHNSFGYYFTYIPTGRNPDVSLMISAEQRLKERKIVADFREKYSRAVFSFWDDGRIVQDEQGRACLAGGRQYLHVLADGGVEPCVFAHFRMPEHNIREMRIEDILKSPFYEAIREKIPTTPDAPCMIIDHPYVLRELIRCFGAVSLDGSEATLTGSVAAFLDGHSSGWREVIAGLSVPQERVYTASGCKGL